MDYLDYIRKDWLKLEESKEMYLEEFERKYNQEIQKQRGGKVPQYHKKYSKNRSSVWPE